MADAGIAGAMPSGTTRAAFRAIFFNTSVGPLDCFCVLLYTQRVIEMHEMAEAVCDCSSS